MTMATTHTNNDLFTAGDVARFCSVDLKTIHNWADRNHIKFFRTPGRHLRFRRLDVLEFLRKFGYPIPAEVQQLHAPGAHGKPRVMVIEADSTKIPSIIEKLGDIFEVQTRSNLPLALMAIGETPPEAVVFGSDSESTFKEVAELRDSTSTRSVQRGRKAPMLSKSDQHAKIKVLVQTGDLDDLRHTLIKELAQELHAVA